MLHIDTDIPAGNALVESIDGDVISLRPDLRDTDQEWFYWHLRVRGCRGRRITLRMLQNCCLSVRGPAVSLDQGQHWQWAGGHVPFSNEATYDCGPHDECWFSMGMPYAQPALDSFIARCAKHPQLRLRKLCTSRKGRRVPYLDMGRDDGQERQQISISARHHCCEMMASWALEGLVEKLLSNDDLLNHSRIFILPMVDFDGCLDGDQGKARRPHDHNRDYGSQAIYPETRAYQDLLRQHADQRFRLALDLHCPFIFGAEWNHHIYMVGNADPGMWQRQQAFAQHLERVSQGPLPYHAKRNLAFGQAWNTGSNYSAGCSCAQWVSTQFSDSVMATTLEIPYATVDDIPVTQDSARAFGHDLAAAIASYLTSFSHAQEKA